MTYQTLLSLNSYLEYGKSQKVVRGLSKHAEWKNNWAERVLHKIVLKWFFYNSSLHLMYRSSDKFFAFMGRIGKALMILLKSVKRTGSQFSTCSLMKLHFSNLWLVLSFNNPNNMSLSDLRVYFKLQVYFRAT